MNIFKAKKIYCAGVGGIGLSALARILLHEGKEVYGSDREESLMIEELRKLGAHIITSEDASAFPSGVEVLIYSAALPENNSIRSEARQRNIPEMVYPEALGQLIDAGKLSIAISGTNGKTTTTALTARIFEEASFDPTVVVGSVVKEWKSNARLGKKDTVIVEACEHKAHMLYLNPDVIVLTNIEEDHLDYYKDLEHITQTFQAYVQKLPKHGWLIKNNDDVVSRERIIKTPAQIKTYGIEKSADVMAKDIVSFAGSQSFEVWVKEKYFGDVNLRIPGKINVYNALAALTAALALGVEREAVERALNTFHGTWRRFEILGAWKEATIISDYAHHPTSIQATIAAAREWYPKQRIIAVFQPHQKNRTKKLFEGFVEALTKADVVIMPEIFYVQGREENIQISSRDIVKKINKVPAWYAENLEDTKKVLEKQVRKGDVILMMGAGDIYTLSEQLC